MKKGLLLALTLMVLVVLVLPASALAPTINLNGIVIGDNESGEISGTGTAAKHLFRYNTAAQFINPTTNADITIVRKNGFPANQLHVFYMTNKSPQVIKASTKTAIVAEVVAGDLTKLTDGSGFASFNAKDIVTDSNGDGTDDFYWLSLINDGAGKLTKTNSYDATAADSGMTEAEYTPYVGHEASKIVSLTLYAAETDNPTTYGTKTVSVWTVAGADDGTTGSAWTQIKQWTFNAGAEGWLFDWFKDATYSYIQKATEITPANGTLIHRAGAPAANTMKYGSWYSPNQPADVAIDVSQSVMQDKLLRADCVLKATATSYQNCPGWRIFYNNKLFNMAGGALMSAASSAVKQYKIAPSASTPLTVTLLFAPQFTLTGMADGGTLDRHVTTSGSTTPADVDWRDMYMQFDILDTDSTDTGDLLLDSVTVYLGDEPAAGATKLAEWGTASGAIAFNAAVASGGFFTGDTGNAGLLGGYGNGTASATAGALTMQLTGPQYKKVVTYPDATGVPAWHSDKIVKNTITISTSDQKRTPIFRFLTFAQTSTGTFLPLQWVNNFDAGNQSYKYQPAMVNTTPPATPQTSATALEYWLFTHTANPATGVVLTQQFDMYNALTPATGWSLENAVITISGLKVEEFAKTW